MGMSSTPKKISIDNHEGMDINAVTSEERSSEEKTCSKALFKDDNKSKDVQGACKDEDGESSEGMSNELPKEGIPKEQPMDMSKDLPNVSEDGPEGESKAIPMDVTNCLSDQLSKDEENETSNGTPKDTKVSKDSIDVSCDGHVDTSKAVQEETPKKTEMTKNTTEKMSEDITMDVSEDAPSSEDISVDLPEEQPNKISSDESEVAKEEVSKLLKDLSEDVSMSKQKGVRKVESPKKSSTSILSDEKKGKPENLIKVELQKTDVKQEPDDVSKNNAKEMTIQACKTVTEDASIGKSEVSVNEEQRNVSKCEAKDVPADSPKVWPKEGTNDSGNNGTKHRMQKQPGKCGKDTPKNRLADRLKSELIVVAEDIALDESRVSSKVGSKDLVKNTPMDFLKDTLKSITNGLSKDVLNEESNDAVQEVMKNGRDTPTDGPRSSTKDLLNEITKDLAKDISRDLFDVTKNFKNSRKFMGKKPAEVFRTDFITAMKLPETQQLNASDYLTLTDPWRQEWEKGVQVPVNPEKIPKPDVRKIEDLQLNSDTPFVLPTKRITFNEKEYIASFDRSTTSCDYDLDDVDKEWLIDIQSLRSLKNKANSIDELTMERAITWFERQCFEKMAHEVATKKGLSIEYDESTTCNVCLSPDAEDGNEIIFCDACNMCAHQHCYGVLDIPEGTWLCNPCSRGNLSPPCCLCPNKGGAMKRMKDSLEWIHVICAWWVPEVKIEDVKFIERITKDKIPNTRWNLTCSICWEKTGACIQCSVKRCVRAYHITCAVKEGLEMKTVVDPVHDDVQHISFCSKHCSPVPPENNPHLNNKSGEDVENNRQRELRKLESEFYSLVSVKKASRELKLSREVTRRMLSYWTMKRRDNENASLIPLTLEQQEKLSGKQGVVLLNQQKTLEMERFLLLRQDLERLRNLCYMIVRREKMRKELHRSSIDIFLKQNEILLDKNEDLSGDNIDFIRHRTTKFSRFSEYYQTENEYEIEHGEKLPMFDESMDDNEDLLKSDMIERVNPDDFERPLHNSTDTKPAKKWHYKGVSAKFPNTSKKSNAHARSTITKKSEVVVEKADVTDSICSNDEESERTTCKDIAVNLETRFQPAENSNSMTDSERNIFELLVPKKENGPCSNSPPPVNDCTADSKLTRTFASELDSKSNTSHSTDTSDRTDRSDITNTSDSEKYVTGLPEISELKTSPPPPIVTSQIEVTESAFNTFSEFLDNQVHENGFSPPEETKLSVREMSDKFSNLAPIPNNCVLSNTSSLFKRKKRRFRNLFDCEGQTRRNSPRLQQNKPEDDNTATTPTSVPLSPTKDSLGERISKLINETKRRRLNSTGDDYPADIKDEPPDYVRITRSRGSGSQVSGTA